MSDCVKVTACTSCMHREVCKHKENYLKVCEAVFDTRVNEFSEDGQGITTIPLSNFECIGSIFVTCAFYSPENQTDCIPATNEKHGEWDYWAGWYSNHDLRLEDATCPFCGYKHTVIRHDRQAPKKLPKQCPNCNAFLDIHAEDK